MKAKTITIMFMTTILALIWSSAAWAGRSNIRDHRQKQRIRQGVRSGEIARPEARRLKKEQHRIHRAYRRASADGHLNWRERRRLNNMQNHASRHIYRAKHNRFRRYHRRHYHHGHYRVYRHRRANVHNHNVNYYYPAIEPYCDDGYEFSMGVSDMGWQFAFSGRDSQ